MGTALRRRFRRMVEPLRSCATSCSTALSCLAARLVQQGLGRYDSGMTTKIAVSLPDHLVVSARAAVADGRAESMSAYVADALAHQSRRERLADVLKDLDDEFGEPSAEDLMWADRALG